jgi:hypothetical protein
VADEAGHEAELSSLREDNEALRYSSLEFGQLADRLSERVRQLERQLEAYRRLCTEQVALVKRLERKGSGGEVWVNADARVRQVEAEDSGFSRQS